MKLVEECKRQKNYPDAITYNKRLIRSKIIMFINKCLKYKRTKLYLSQEKNQQLKSKN
jgi:hypothetical protein